VFLTALAIFDDIGGILVIAIFYGHGLHALGLFVAAATAGAAFLAGRFRLSNPLLYAGLGIVLWLALHEGGIHATIAGVLLGLAIPATASRPAKDVIAQLHAHTATLIGRVRDEELDAAEVLTIEQRLEELEAPVARFVHALHPIVAFLIMPLFALANSGVSLDGVPLSALWGPITIGTALGLFVGKQLGIFAFTIALVRSGKAPMPGTATATKLYGVATVGGIGFTVALFIAGLAFPVAPDLLDQAKIGILAGSLASGLVGSLILRMTAPVVATASGPGT
jgi:Na+:H+ antiporter, NhaA family